MEKKIEDMSEYEIEQSLLNYILELKNYQQKKVLSAIERNKNNPNLSITVALEREFGIKV